MFVVAFVYQSEFIVLVNYKPRKTFHMLKIITACYSNLFCRVRNCNHD